MTLVDSFSRFVIPLKSETHTHTRWDGGILPGGVKGDGSVEEARGLGGLCVCANFVCLFPVEEQAG